MRLSRLTAGAFALSATAVMTTGCGGNEASPFGAPPNLSLRSDVVPLMPDKRKKMLYEYESTLFNGGLLEFDYPKGDSSIGEISGVSEPQGECTNVLFGAGKKTFWVTASGTDQIDEFKVGGSSPIKTLSTPSGDVPVGCAMDPATGNLAATIINTGAVVIYANASGSGTVSPSPLIEAFFAGYDNNSNLYVDGFNNEGAFGFVVLKKGNSTWETLSTSNTVEFAGQVQFDGTYMTVTDSEADAIYGYACRGISCKLKRTVSLSGSCDSSQTWIGIGVVFCPPGVYKYPAGGSPIATLIGYGEPFGFVEVRK
jgi:hypothetical protein